jgi:hypothetical protein
MALVRLFYGPGFKCIKRISRFPGSKGLYILLPDRDQSLRYFEKPLKARGVDEDADGRGLL